MVLDLETYPLFLQANEQNAICVAKVSGFNGAPTYNKTIEWFQKRQKICRANRSVIYCSKKDVKIIASLRAQCVNNSSGPW